jgi:hypothetical protein
VQVFLKLLEKNEELSSFLCKKNSLSKEQIENKVLNLSSNSVIFHVKKVQSQK